MTDFHFEEEKAIHFIADGQEAPVYGYSPRPGENGNWYIYDTFNGWQDTGIKVSPDYDDSELRRLIAEKYSRPSDGIPESDLSEEVKRKLNESAVTSVNGQTGDVTIDVPDVSGLQDKLIPGANITIEGNVISATGGGGGAVNSVNGKTGVVTLNAADVGALPSDTPIPAPYDDTQIKEDLSQLDQTINGKYTKPASGIPATDLAAGVIPPAVTDEHINSLIDDKLTPIDALADDITEVVGA